MTSTRVTRIPLDPFFPTHVSWYPHAILQSAEVERYALAASAYSHALSAAEIIFWNVTVDWRLKSQEDDNDGVSIEEHARIQIPTPKNKIITFAWLDRVRVLLACEDRTVYTVHVSGEILSKFEHSDDSGEDYGELTCMSVDFHASTLWMGTCLGWALCFSMNGNASFNLLFKYQVVPDLPIMALVQQKDGKWYAGTALGTIVSMDDDAMSSERIVIPSKMPVSALASFGHEMFVGDENGNVFVLRTEDGGGREWQRLHEFDGPVLSMVAHPQAPDRYFMISTFEGDVCMLDTPSRRIVWQIPPLSTEALIVGHPVPALSMLGPLLALACNARSVSICRIDLHPTL